jgi:anaerobic magnesium-protoporphyrin IX monomethyl ester cyclase
MRIGLATRHASPHYIPLALLYLKAYLVERQGHPFEDVPILEFDRDCDHERIARDLLAAEPDVLGLSCYVWNVRALLAAARQVKAARPNVRIVIGGPEVGPVARAVLEAHPWVDVVVQSEGEIPFAGVVAAWKAGRGVESVPGIAFREGTRVVENVEAPLLRDLNALPSPHTAQYASGPGRIICIETQRGCVFRCNFCFYNKDLSVRNRRFDIERVKAEILFWLQQEGVRQIYLMDPIFNLDARRAKEICRFIIAHNQRRVPFHSEVWAEFIDEELARLMREAPLTLEVGLQTTDATALATVERRLRVKPFVDGIRWLKQQGLSFELQLIYGLPGETLASFRQSLNFAMSLDPPDLAVFPLMVLPGTELWQKADGLGLRFDPDPPYYVREHGSMGAADVEFGARMIDAIGHLGHSRTIRFLCREPGLAFDQIVDEWIAWWPNQPDTEPAMTKLRRFVEHVCATRGIPPRFYQGFASFEFKE